MQPIQGLQIRASSSNYTEKSRSEVGIQSVGQDILILWNPNNVHQNLSSVPMVGEISWVHNRQPLFLKSFLFLIPLKKYFLASEVNLHWTVLLSGGNNSIFLGVYITKTHSLRVQGIQSDI
jgi:hypothetical protein